MFLLMKQEFDKTTNAVLEWRMENFKYWFSKIPELIEFGFQVNDTNIELHDIEIEDSNPNATYHGFCPLNIKVLKLTTRHPTQKEPYTTKLHIPVPTIRDIYEVNASYYVLMNEFVDYPVTTYDDIIRIRFFRIDPDGTFSFISTKGVRERHPLASVLVSLDILSKDDFEVVESKELPQDVEWKGRGYIRFKKYSGTPFDDLILKSLNKVRSLEQLSGNVMNGFFKNFKPPTFMIYFIEKFYDFKFSSYDPKTFLKEIIERVTISLYNQTYKSGMIFPDLRQKHVVHYDAIVDYIIKQLVDKPLQRPKYQQSIRVDANAILKWLVAGNPRFQCITSFENPYREINLKETIITQIENPLPSYRTVDMTYLYNVDPINTPDNQKLGMVQRLSKTVKLDEFGRFVEIEGR